MKKIAVTLLLVASCSGCASFKAMFGKAETTFDKGTQIAQLIIDDHAAVKQQLATLWYSLFGTGGGLAVIGAIDRRLFHRKDAAKVIAAVKANGQ